MAITGTEIVAILTITKELVEWAAKQQALGNITQEQFDEIFADLRETKDKWDSLAPKDIED